MNNTTKLATIDHILGGVPQFKCLDGCHDCCGPVVMSRLEWLRIIRRVGRSEKDLQKEATNRIEAGNFECIFLGESGCNIYDIRPAVCRVFGASEHRRLTCPHGAKPEKPLTAKETDAMIDTISLIGL